VPRVGALKAAWVRLLLKAAVGVCQSAPRRTPLVLCGRVDAENINTDKLCWRLHN